MSTATLPGTTLARTVTLYDASGNPVSVVLGRDGTYALAADPRLVDEVTRIREIAEKFLEMSDDLMEAILSLK